MPEDRSSDLWTRLERLSVYTTEVVHSNLDPYLPPDVVASPYYLPGVALLAGLPTSYVIYRALWIRRYPTALHIPLRAFEKHKSIKGKIVAVGDSDNFRIYHAPGWFTRVPSKEALKGELMKQTINIRVAGVDAPESAHFGMPAQPFSAESKAWLTNYVLGRSVIVKLLSRDRYDRVIAMAYVRRLPFPFPRRNVSLEMLKAGMATVYTAKGAEYGGMLDKFERAEQMARQSHKGMWSQDMKKYISPGDHKKQHLRGMDV